MDTLAEWLARISWPLITRVLTAAGIGTVTYTGASTALNTALGSVKTALAGIGGDVLQLLAMAGFFEAMSITAGGIVSGLSWMVLKRFALQSGTA
jgi:hypothetical protein